MTFDTVLIDTSATRATSRMVTDMPTHLPASAGVFNARTHNEVQHYYVEDRSRGRSNLGIEIHAHIAERGPWGCSGHTGGDLGRRGPAWFQARFQGPSCPPRGVPQTGVRRREPAAGCRDRVGSRSDRRGDGRTSDPVATRPGSGLPCRVPGIGD